MAGRAGATRYCRGVDALKGLAILGIVFYHYYRRLSGTGNSFQWWFGPLPRHPQEWGYLGASLFFILSGWALTASAMAKRAAGRPESGAADFFRDRARRILPLYYLSLLLIFAGFFVLTEQPPAKISLHFLAKATFLHAFSPETIFSYNSSWWFMGPLAFLYLVYPWLRRGFERNADLALALCLLAAFLLSHLLAEKPVLAWHPYLAMGGFPFVKLGEFGFGIWVARTRETSSGKVAALTGLLLVVGWLGLRSPLLFPLHPLGLCAPLVVVASWLPLFGLESLGRYSFGLFLFHRPLIDPWLAWLRRQGFADSAWLGPAIFTILVLAMTIPVERAIEYAFRRKTPA